MASLATIARDDAAAFVDTIGQDITLTEPDGVTTHTIKALVSRADQKIDPDSRSRFHEPFTEVFLSVKTLGSVPTDEWQATVEDAGGRAVTGYLTAPEHDQTRDTVTAYIEVQQ